MPAAIPIVSRLALNFRITGFLLGFCRVSAAGMGKGDDGNSEFDGIIRACYHVFTVRDLQQLDQEFPGPVPLHLVMDNYGTHQHSKVRAKVRAWLQRHPRFVPHSVPTSSSWLNLIERWFGELTTKRVRRGSFHSVEDLQKAIAEFLAAWNEHPRPFLWTATVESIQEKLSRCRQTLEQIQPGCTQPRSRRRQKRLSS